MRLNEVYKDSGLGKWFHKQSATQEPGWDRYNTVGKRVGKCGDAKEGESYSACLSKQKAKKLGKEGISSFVKRKREAQSEAGRAEKGTGTKGKKPIFVKTGAAKKKVNESMENLNEDCGCGHNDKKSSLMDKIKEKMKKKLLKEEAALGKPFRTPGGPKKFAVRVKNEKGNEVIVRFGDPNMEIKRDDPSRRKNFRARHNCENPGPRTKARYWSCRMWEKGKSVTQLTKECLDFTELDLTTFRNKKTLVETVKGNYYGTLGIFKNNFALFEGEEVTKVLDPSEITKVVCEDTRVIILEKNVPNDSEKWSDCKSQAKSKFDVYPSAYANAWASKCYKKKGGTWKKVNEELDTQMEILSEKILHRGDNWVVTDSTGKKVLGTHPSKEKALAQLRAVEASKASRGIHEEADLVLRERLKNRFFTQISEDIVNKDNKGKLTPQASNPKAKSRDKIREKVKDRSKVVTGPKDKNGKLIRMDTPEEASYRLATFIELKKKGKLESSKKKNKK